MNNGFSPSRRAWNRVMTVLVWASAVLVMILVAGIIGMVLVRGIPHISWNFLSTTASVLKKTDGILPAILNTLYVILLTLLIVLPLGVGAAVYLTEYASNRRLIEVIEFTNETLAGIPSIIYGLVGMLVFSQALGFQTCLLSGSLTLVVMNLPTIIRTTQESLKTVPQGYREGAMGLGAGKWHIIRTIVLPCSIDGIVTGCILAVGRIVGESAALLFTAGGIALPPMRCVIWNALDEREKYRDVTIIYGAKTPADLVYKHELKEWEEREDVRLITTVDPGGQTPDWNGEVGFVPDVVASAGLSAENTPYTNL